MFYQFLERHLATARTTKCRIRRPRCRRRHVWRAEVGSVRSDTENCPASRSFHSHSENETKQNSFLNIKIESANNLK